MQFELAVLDIAGTTVFDGDAVNACLRRSLSGVAGLEVNRDAANRVMGLPKPVAIRTLLEEAGLGRPTDSTVSQVLEEFERQMLDYYANSPGVREMEGASEVFGQLRAAGIKIGLDTGFSRRITNAILARLGWLGASHADATVASDEVPAGRPAPDMIFRLMEQCRVSSAVRVAKVGDTPADLLEGAAAGCGAVIGVFSGSHTADQLAQHPHTALIPSIRQLPAMLIGSDTAPHATSSSPLDHPLFNKP